MEYVEPWDVATPNGHGNGNGHASNGINGTTNGINGTTNGVTNGTTNGSAVQGSEEKTFVASMGLYVFSKQLLIKLLKEDCADAADFARDILPRIFAQRYGAAGDYAWLILGVCDTHRHARLRVHVCMQTYTQL